MFILDRVQRKIFWIIATNFMSWIPICLLSFLRLQKYYADHIGGTVYQVAAIVLLPVNSAINPILYSNSIRNLFKKYFTYKKELRKSPGRFGSVDTLATRSTTDHL